jgi:hypothetical protein
MGINKKGKKLPPEYQEKAIANGLSLSTVYDRLNRGWDLDKAVNTPPTRKTYASSSERIDGSIKATDRPRGRTITFSTYKDIEPLLNDAIKESGKSKSQFIADAVEQYLLKLWKPKTK